MANTAVHEFMVQANGRRIREFTVSDINVKIEADREHDEQAKMLAEALVSHAVGVEFCWRSLEIETQKANERAERYREDARIARSMLPPPSPVRLMAPGCVRFDTTGVLWLLGGRERGWAAFGVMCDGWDDLFRRYNVSVTAHGTDEFGAWWQVENCKPRERHHDRCMTPGDDAHLTCPVVVGREGL